MTAPHSYRALLNWLFRPLCWIGIHNCYGGWCDDGKGNSGSFLECQRCHAIFEDVL